MTMKAINPKIPIYFKMGEKVSNIFLQRGRFGFFRFHSPERHIGHNNLIATLRVNAG